MKNSENSLKYTNEWFQKNEFTNTCLCVINHELHDLSYKY